MGRRTRSHSILAKSLFVARTAVIVLLVGVAGGFGAWCLAPGSFSTTALTETELPARSDTVQRAALAEYKATFAEWRDRPLLEPALWVDRPQHTAILKEDEPSPSGLRREKGGSFIKISGVNTLIAGSSSPGVGLDEALRFSGSSSDHFMRGRANLSTVETGRLGWIGEPNNDWGIEMLSGFRGPTARGESTGLMFLPQGSSPHRIVSDGTDGVWMHERGGPGGPLAEGWHVERRTW